MANTQGETNGWPRKLSEAKGLDRQTTYAAYLRSDAWRLKREEAIKHSGGTCQLCNRADHLHVHHRTYERVGEEAVGDLTVLCRRCHHTFHKGGRKPQGKSRPGHHRCQVCGKNYTTKARCRPCRKAGRKPKRTVSQGDIDRLADAMNGKWKPTSRIP